VALRVVGHVTAIVVIYLMFSFSLFLGLQVNPTYGNIGIVVTAGAAIAYVLWARRLRSRR
jgi:multisubunit Na+/H+ antiporter MnhB subunit